MDGVISFSNQHTYIALRAFRSLLAHRAANHARRWGQCSIKFIDWSPRIDRLVSMISERLRRAVEQSIIALESEDQEHLADHLFARLDENANALAELLHLIDADDGAATSLK